MIGEMLKEVAYMNLSDWSIKLLHFVLNIVPVFHSTDVSRVELLNSIGPENYL